jgi:hypothetical protein
MLVLSDAGIAFMPTCAAAFIPNLVMLGDAPKVAAIACPPKLSGSTRRAQAQTPSSFGVQTSTMAASTPTCSQPVHPMIPIALIVAMAMRASLPLDDLGPTRLVSSIRPAMSGMGRRLLSLRLPTRSPRCLSLRLKQLRIARPARWLFWHPHTQHAYSVWRPHNVRLLL